VKTAKKNFMEPPEQNSAAMPVELQNTEIISKKEAKERNLGFYFTGKECGKGHISKRYVNDSKCIQCVSERNSKRYSPEKRRKWHENYYSKNSHKVKKYQEENRQQILETKRIYREKNRTEINKKKRLWNKRNKQRIRDYKDLNAESIKLKNANYYRLNKPVISVRVKEYNKRNPMQSFVRSTLKRIERAIGESRINKAELDLGYIQADFIAHIGSLFKPGMSWGNRSEWHIDHIKPVSAFLKEGVTDITVINALTNLQPLWAKENMEKYNKWQ